MAAIGSTSNALTAGLTASSSSARSDGQQIAGNFQQFLTLLTTQLKNQSPLDPLDTNQFTQQLVQFASVEQQLKTNDTLKTLVAGSKASAASAAAGLVGSNVTADGASAAMSNGAVTWTVNPAKAAAAATLTVKDASGTVVATQSKALAAGAQSFTWDGRTTSGGRAAAGSYTLSISARDASGQPVEVSTLVTGQVTSVDLAEDTPMLVIGTSKVPITALKSVGG